MGKKSESDLALADKIDAARTILKLKQRSQYRKEMNEVEAAIESQHHREVQEGKLTTIDYGDTPLLGSGEGKDTQDS